MAGAIRIRGAREHNLRIDRLDLPCGRWIVITGVSGSGKSSLAFDTLYREGERRFLETLSPGARRALGRVHKPRVTSIEGLSPAIAIDARSAGGGRWATVATIAGIDDPLRLLFARIGRPHCPACGLRIEASPPGRIADEILIDRPGREAWILAPVIREGTGDVGEILEHLREQGFARARIDGEVVRLADAEPLDPARPHAVEVVCDRIVVAPERRSRIEEAVETAVAIGDGTVIVDEGGRPARWSAHLACAQCGLPFPALVPALFSFRSPHGACPACGGLGAASSGESCEACGGRRLNPASLSVRIGDRSIADIRALSVADAMDLLDGLDLDAFDPTGRARAGGASIVARARASLSLLFDVGLGYISLDRTADSLASGEAQRARLAGRLGAGLRGVLYVLDEPSVGLHPHDLEGLLRAIARLRDGGNTVIVVEHDRDAIEAADHIVDVGPGAGRDGGLVVAQGPPEAIAADPRSVTGRHLRGGARPSPPEGRRAPGSAALVI
ncbi:MAG: ABC-ATPase UvrA, partial [Planctomycetes bacterium]|nr:ABC-ATPase UvrA [Planctomycetota bacterium]